jgi:hypothetical protein
MEVVTRFNQAEAKHTHTQTPGTLHYNHITGDLNNISFRDF